MTHLVWTDLQYFRALANEGSLPKAAEKLGVNRTTISRHVSNLEASLGATLFERRGRNLVLTTAGREVIAVSDRVDGEIDALTRQVFGRDRKLEGAIRVTATSAMAKLIAPELAVFGAEHPGIVLDVMVSNANVDLDLMEADIAIRLTRQPPDNLVGRKLADINSALYVANNSRLNLAGNDVPYVGWNAEREAPLWVRESAPGARVVATGNFVDVIAELVAVGVGFAEIPCYAAQTDARLRRVSEPTSHRFGAAWLLYNPQLRGVRRVSALVDHLTGVFERLRPTIEGRSMAAVVP